MNETEQQASFLEMKKMLILAKSEITNLRMENLLLRRNTLLTFVGGRESTPSSEKIERNSSIGSFEMATNQSMSYIEEETLRNEILQLKYENDELKKKNNYRNKNNNNYDSITIIKSHMDSDSTSEIGENNSENGKISLTSEIRIGDVYERKSSKFFEFHFADELAGLAVTELEKKGSENFRKLSISMNKKEIIKNINDDNNDDINNNDSNNTSNKSISNSNSKNGDAESGEVSEGGSPRKFTLNGLGIVPRNVTENVLEICPRNRNVYSNERNRNKRPNSVIKNVCIDSTKSDKSINNDNNNNNNNDNSNDDNNNNNKNNDDSNKSNNDIDHNDNEIKNRIDLHCDNDDNNSTYDLEIKYKNKNDKLSNAEVENSKIRNGENISEVMKVKTENISEKSELELNSEKEKEKEKRKGNEKEVVVKVVDEYADDYEALQLILSIEEKLVIIDDYMKFNNDVKKEKDKEVENRSVRNSPKMVSTKTILPKMISPKLQIKEKEPEGVMDVLYSTFLPFLVASPPSPSLSPSPTSTFSLKEEVSPLLSPLPLSTSTSSVFSLSGTPSDPTTPLTSGTSNSFPMNSMIFKSKSNDGIRLNEYDINNMNNNNNNNNINDNMNDKIDNNSDNNNKNNGSTIIENNYNNDSNGIDYQKDKEDHNLSRNPLLNRNFKIKRGLRRNTRKDILRDGEKLKDEIDGMFDETRLNVISGFLEIVSTVFSPLRNEVTDKETKIAPVGIDHNDINNKNYFDNDIDIDDNDDDNDNDDNYNNDNNNDIDYNDKIINDGDSALIVKNLENSESSTCLPVGYYDANLRQFCRVLPKYEVSPKKLKRKDNNVIDFTRI